MEAIYFGNAHWHHNTGALTPGAKSRESIPPRTSSWW